MTGKKLVSKYNLVHIKWHDAAIHGRGQISIDDVKGYGLIHDHVAGWLIDKTKDHVTIAMDFFPKSEQNEKDSFRCLSSYPMSGIEKMTVLKILEVYED